MFCGLSPTFVEVTGEKLIGGPFSYNCSITVLEKQQRTAIAIAEATFRMFLEQCFPFNAIS